MQQNNIWIDYLRLGIRILFVFALSSCKKDAISSKADWHYINETNHEIEVHIAPIPHDDFTIKPLEEGWVYGKIVFEDSKITDFVPPVVYALKYDGIKCDTVKGFEISLWNILNYKAKEVSDNYYQYTYRFTEADYERAVKCE